MLNYIHFVIDFPKSTELFVYLLELFAQYVNYIVVYSNKRTNKFKNTLWKSGAVKCKKVCTITDYDFDMQLYF